MIYRIYPSKDATIYEDSLRKNQNTGKDEILEIGKFYDTDNTTLLGNSRTLVQFDLTEISQSVVDGVINMSPLHSEYRLKLENIESSEIQSNFDLYVFPVRQDWNEGVGSESDTPHNELDVTWVHNSSSSEWDVLNSTVGKRPGPYAGGMISYNDFLAGAGNFELINQIKGVDGTSPSINVVDGALQLSASMYGGGTLNLSASFYENTIYQLYFEATVGTLNGIDFRIYEPDENGNATTEGTYLQNVKITTDGTHSLEWTGSNSGVHLIQFTYFDTDGTAGVAGALDNIILNKKMIIGEIINDEFNIDGFNETWIESEPIIGVLGETASVAVESNKLAMSSSNYSGQTLYREFTAISGCLYTASYDADLGNYPYIRFGVQSPDGIMLVDENHTTSGTNTEYFTADQDATYYIRFTYFADGTEDFTGTIDNVRLNTDPDLIPKHYFTTLDYDANWGKTQGGGTWYTSSYTSGSHYKQSFTKYSSNLDVNITDYVNEWLDGTRANNGLIIKKSNADECSTTKFGSMKFFSSDTHTIYPPVLEVKLWDFVWDTGSLQPLTTTDPILYVKGLSTEYKQTSKAHIRVYGRERFPERSFTSSPIKSVKYLDPHIYYSVVDAETEQVIIPFDTYYTRVSCDGNGNYFNFWFNHFIHL